ncbi:cytochrome P450 [Mameliella alba]|uniref:cytochrome P450 n=1 Tax=Mameliella alba TaxID=561184 RepID=UPI001431B038|nr:cytochrome P450 [Mameliella alba]
MAQAPINEAVSLADLARDPYSIYRRMRLETPIVEVPAARRIMLTKAKHTRMVKDNAELYSSDDPVTPMQRAFQAHTLMRKDGPEHRAERMAMQKALSPKVIKSDWAELYRKIASDYLDRLPCGERVDLFTDLCGPVAARILAHILGLDEASDADMMRWSQTLIDGAGNFGFAEDPFAKSDAANAEMNAYFDRIEARHRAEPNNSAFSIMLNAANPLPIGQIHSNIKIAIGGGINEPRDALATILYGLLSNPEQLEEVKRTEAWSDAFEEGVRWVAPIQASSRRVTEAHQIDGIDIPEGVTLMTIQASANHDEDLFENGHLFDVFRKKAPHQAFGSGPHHCSGAQVARKTVGEIMLPMIFERFPNMELVPDEKVIWHGFGFRGPLNLPVTLN